LGKGAFEMPGDRFYPDGRDHSRNYGRWQNR
jgi:hypothetical protein